MYTELTYSHDDKPSSDYFDHNVTVKPGAIFADIEIDDKVDGVQYNLTWFSHNTNRSGAAMFPREETVTVSHSHDP